MLCHLWSISTIIIATLKTRLVLYIRKKNSKQSFPFPLYGNYERKPKINFTWEKHNKENGDSATLWGST